LTRSGRSAEAARRFAERRRREDAAPRLLARVPDLRSLRLDITEANEDGAVYATYTRHVLVDRAPALFELPCGDSACEGGGHDLTAEILRRLASGDERFEVSSRCSGTVGPNGCRRRLRVIGLPTRATGT